MNQLSFRNSRGFTIVELMIALAISTVMVLTIVSMFGSTKQSFRLQTALSGVNETGRFTIDTISWHVRMAGAREQNFEAGPIPGAITATNDNPDTLTLVYESTFDCNQQPPDATGRVTNVFDINAGVLRCNDQVVFDGVEDMQVFVGLDTDGDGVANQLVPPSAAIDMEDAVSISVNLLVQSDADNVSDGPQALVNAFWSTGTPTDSRLRREYTATIALRN